MADRLGRITVPTPVSSGLTFPLLPDYGFGYLQQGGDVIEHRFGSGATLQTQRFFTGFGARQFDLQIRTLSYADRITLINFYQAVQGSFQSFTYNAPSPGSSATTPYEVIFKAAPLILDHSSSRSSAKMTFIEIVSTATMPVYPVSGVDTRFPGAVLTPALLSETQQLIPLIHIKVRDPGVPDLYLSDRRSKIGGQVYLPRVLDIGVAGSSVILSQDISGKSDNLTFTLGNADRAMSLFIKDTSLQFSQIDLSLYHVQSQVLLQLWKGTVISWQLDGSPNFKIQCADGLWPVMQAYPRRIVSRQCWKTFNDGENCPWSHVSNQLIGPGALSGSCDYYFNSPNGCLAHGMSPYFGGHPDFPQSVVIKDDGTGIVGGFLRSTVTSTSIVSDSIWGKALPEIWANDSGSPQLAYWANALVAAVRDESTFEDVLGIIGAGPIGGYEGMTIQTNADGYMFIVAPFADGFPPQGLKVNSSLQLTGPIQSGYGLRQTYGADPAVSIFGVVNINNLTVTWVSGANFSNPIFSSGNSINFQIGGNTVSAVILAVASSTVLYLLPMIVGVSEQGYGVYNNVLWAIVADAFSLGQGTPQNWFVADPNFGNTLSVSAWSNNILSTTSGSGQIIPFAAGTAITELRYSKSPGSGISPTRAGSHTMSIPISRGLTGYTYNPGGSSQSVVFGLTNPFWIAVNSYWRALGISPTDVTNQLATIILSSITNSAGSGAADIANLSITPVIGVSPSGATIATVTQWVFQGSIGPDIKPFRDWLIEILNTAMGYFSFQFGQLRLGIRFTAVPSISYTVSNMLYQSLRITPAAQHFEDLTIYYADRDLQGQQNTAQYSDKDHAAYYGRAGSPLAAHIRSVGTCTLEQGLRYATIRTREEIGGILRSDLSDPYVEFDNCNLAVWKSTVLALDTDIGDVVEITHPDIPTYPGPPAGLSGPNFNPPGSFPANTWPFRVRKWTLFKDYSVEIEAQSVTDSMYALETGPKVTGVPVGQSPILYYQQPLGCWQPWQVQALSTDALYPNEYTFALAQLYTILADGTASGSATVTGHLPVTAFLPSCGAPQIKAGLVTQSPSGGTLPGGQTLYVAICASNGSAMSPPSDILAIQIPAGTNTNQITISGIQWPATSALTTFYVFASADPNNVDPFADTLMCFQSSGALASGPNGYTPTSIALSTPLARSTWGLPDPNVQLMRMKYKLLPHGGVLGAAVSSAYGSTIVSAECVDIALTDNWAGRVLAIIGRNNTSAPFQAFSITAFAPSTGTFTLSQPVSGILPGDAFVVCFLGYNNSAAPYVFTDSGISNAANVTQTGVAASIFGVFFSNPSNGLTTTIAGKTYTFQTTLTNVDGNVLIGGSIVATISNLYAAVNRGAGAGAVYAASMSANPNCMATASTSTSITFTAILPGTIGNSLTATGTLGYPVGGLFTGGANAGVSAPHTGLSVNFEKGLVGRIIAGTGRGTTANVVSNTATSYTFDAPMLMDSTSVLIIEAAAWYPVVDTLVPANVDPAVTQTVTLPVINYEKTSLLVEGVLVDQNGNESPDGDSFVRMLYLYGNGGDTGASFQIAFPPGG